MVPASLLIYNALGWILSGALLCISVEMLSTTQYKKSVDKRSWLPQLLPSPRSGSRPQVGITPSTQPQRQLSQIPDEDVNAVLHWYSSSKAAATKVIIK